MRMRLSGAGRFRLVVLALVLAVSAAGYLVSAAAVRSDRRATAAQAARLDSVRTQVLLQRASAYVSGLAEQLAVQSRAQQSGFSFVAGTMSASLGLADVLWIPRTPGPLTVRYATTVLPGTAVSQWPALARTLRGDQVLFGVTATSTSRLSGGRGFFVVSSARYGTGRADAGYLAVFIPHSWIGLSLGERPAQVEVTLGGRLLDGHPRSRPVMAPPFQALGQTFRIGRPLPQETALQKWLPWIALSWPILIAFIAILVGSAVAGRRRAERTVERVFDLSPDILCVTGYDGYFKRINPAFEETLGVSREELLSKPYLDFVHPEDRDLSERAFANLHSGAMVVAFRNRYIVADGSVRWLEWNSRPVPRERLIYSAARDVTERQAAEAEVRRAHEALEASRDALQELADDQAALRRVATLVAHGAAPLEVFTAVTREARGLLGAQHAVLLRYADEDTVSVIAIDALAGAGLQVGLTTPIEPDGASGRIKRTGLSTEIIDMHELTGVSAKRLLGLGLQSAAGAPVVVDGRLWGVLGFAWFDRHPAVSNLESRMRAFTDLAATAIANAYSRAELAASRARLVVAADETRRRIERDLHDGVQQRLVSLALAMRTACAQVPEEFHDLRLSLTEAEQGVNEALEDLQEISRGIHPAILNKGGLEPALRALARRTLLPVELSIELPERLPAAIEAVLYYLVSEAVTNATKHADAHSMLVKLGVAHGVVEAAIADDGVGGADPDRGSGLVGLRDRVESVGGTLAVESSPGRGTRLIASIPLEGGLVTSVHERDVLGGGEAPAGGDEVPPDANLGAPAPVTDTPPRATDTPAPGAEDQPPQIRM